MDSKYGRIYTEADVQHIVNFMRLEGAPDHVADAVADLEATGKVHYTFPADEPTFVIRGKDKVAPEAVRAYANLALTAGAVFEFARAASYVSASMSIWQMDNPDRVKVPDTAPTSPFEGENAGQHPKPD